LGFEGAVTVCTSVHRNRLLEFSKTPHGWYNLKFKRRVPLDTNSIISELEAERDRLDRAIIALRDGTQGTARSRRNGRRGRRPLSAEARKKIALSAKRRW